MNSKTSIDLDSFFELIKSRVPLNLDYQTWLTDCILNATLPIHSKFGAVISEFVMSTFLTDQCHKLSDDIVLSLFQDTSGTSSAVTPSQVLMLLYVLAFNDCIIAFRTDPKLISLSGQAKDQAEYPSTVLDRIPIRHILNYVEANKDESAYQSIYSDLLALTANLYPEFFDVHSFLIKEGKNSDTKDAWSIKPIHNWRSTLSLTDLEELISQFASEPKLVLEALGALESVAALEYTEHMFLILRTLIPPALEGQLNTAVAQSFRSVWEAFNRVMPHRLWTMTVNILTKQDYTLEDLIQDPLKLFKSDPRVFRSEELLPIWLHILLSLRTTSKHRIWKRYHNLFPRSNQQQQQQDLNMRNIVALTNAQDTVMLQLLLELCLKKSEDSENEDALQKSRRLICDFIHGIFIDGDRDMLLAKILHFQTYPTELIPLVVEMIPSIYIVMSFIPELIRQPQIEKQVFGILMGCYLCEKYPLENYLLTAEKHILPRLLRIAFPVNREGQLAPSCVPSEFLVKAIPGFVHLARAFPHFGPQILKAFDEIGSGLPQPKEFIGQEGNSKIILLLQLHKVLKDSRDLVQKEVDGMDSVNKITM